MSLAPSLVSLFSMEMSMLLICVQHGGFGDGVAPWLESEFTRLYLLGFGVDLGFHCSVICLVFVHGAAESVETLTYVFL